MGEEGGRPLSDGVLGVCGTGGGGAAKPAGPGVPGGVRPSHGLALGLLYCTPWGGREAFLAQGAGRGPGQGRGPGLPMFNELLRCLPEGGVPPCHDTTGRVKGCPTLSLFP